ncbi:MAG: tRNA (N(6)-L-threonylcarbamoyladenosine(37)-C(2))-methylthiotransferase MtaB [Oscillospiraceae bacterium]|nr:tRNA (N(6)-L-threonylcarbamoyladenosine(37)-C(2))-methylthiotransferase MtaB [Oscillospiraceae bacterium]
MNVAIYTLGCKVNQYETQAIEKLLTERGHTVVDFTQDADAYVVNTCSVTAVSGQKSRQVIRRMRREHPDAVLAVCGCYSQTAPEDVRTLGVDLIAGTGDRTGFVALLEQAVTNRASATREMLDKSRAAFETLDNPRVRRDFELLPAGGMSGRTRAMLKVEDGCNNFCSYCVIPYARGAVRSEPLPDAVRQARELAADGVREIVLTGMEISSWGLDFRDGQTLTDLAAAICAAVPAVRIRLGSLEPRTVTPDFCRRLNVFPNLCPQFHLSLQSGCDATLKRMRRRYDTARYLESVELLRAYFPRPAVTTDLITGFPGETEDEFAQTLSFLRQCGFARTHIFPYSSRPGTPAADMPQLPKAVKEERAARAKAVADATRAEYLSGCVGEQYEVLYEQARGGVFHGHAPNYADVYAPGVGLRNQCRVTRIVSSDGEALYGEIVR